MPNIKGTDWGINVIYNIYIYIYPSGYALRLGAYKCDIALVA